MAKLKTVWWDLGTAGAQAGKERFTRKGYAQRSGAKQLNGRRKMVPSFFPGDLLPPGVEEC